MRLTTVILSTLILLIFTKSNSSAQSNEVMNLSLNADQISTLLQADDLRIGQLDTLVNLSLKYNAINLDSSILFGQKAVDLLSAAQEPTKLTVKSMLALGDGYRIKGDIKKGKKYIFEGLEIATEIKDTSNIAAAHNILGIIELNTGENENAINHFLEALARWEAIRDSQNMFKPYLNISWIYYRIDQSEKAKKYNEKALEWADIMDDDRARMYAFNNMAIIFQDDLYPKDVDSTERAQIRAEASVKASEYYIEAKTIAKARNNIGMEVNVLSNLADLNIIIKNYEEANKYAMDALPLAKKMGATRHLVAVYHVLNRTYLHKKQFNKAIQYGLLGLEMAEGNEMIKKSADFKKTLYQTYKAIGNDKEALTYLEERLSYVKESKSKENNKAIAEIEAKFNVVSMEKEALQNEKEILTLESNSKTISMQRNVILFGSLVVGLIAFFWHRISKIKQNAAQKKAFGLALLSAQESDRKRIASELHDGIGQSLLAIKNSMTESNFSTAIAKPMVANTLEDVRRIALNLHPHILDNFGLSEAIIDLAEQSNNQPNLLVTHDIEKVDSLVEPNATINLYRIVQECMNNILKHSKASAAKINLNSDGTNVNLSIIDNGIGFDTKQKLNLSKSLGLVTIKERVAHINGTFTIDSTPHQSTAINITIPINRFHAN